jgi:hypothetical protein
MMVIIFLSLVRTPLASSVGNGHLSPQFLLVSAGLFFCAFQKDSLGGTLFWGFSYVVQDLKYDILFPHCLLDEICC